MELYTIRNFKLEYTFTKPLRRIPSLMNWHLKILNGAHHQSQHRNQHETDANKCENG